MFCPQCRTEYREGFYTCTDCGVSLVSELLPEPAPEYLEFEEILISLSSSDVAMIKSLLDSEGITYYFRGESSYSFAPPTRLMVQKDRADEAREILEGLDTSGDLAPEDSESGNDE
jgi:Putative prokaryotic signal transducing protein